LSSQNYFPESLDTDQLVIKDFKLQCCGGDVTGLGTEIAQRVGASDDLPILLVDVNEVPFEALVHLGREAAPTCLARLVVKPEEDFEKDHLKAIIIKKELSCKVVLFRLCRFLIMPRLERMNLYGIEYFCAQNEKLVPLILIERIDDKALPKNVDL
jgi:hypothetical protein